MEESRRLCFVTGLMVLTSEFVLVVDLSPGDKVFLDTCEEGDEHDGDEFDRGGEVE